MPYFSVEQPDGSILRDHYIFFDGTSEEQIVATAMREFPEHLVFVDRVRQLIQLSRLPQSLPIPAAAPSSAIPPEDANMVPTATAAGLRPRIGNESWFMVAVRGATTKKQARTIYLEAVPAKGWEVGQKIHARSLNAWRANPAYIVDPELRFVIAKDIPCVYIPGEWRPIYRKLIQEALKISEAEPYKVSQQDRIVFVELLKEARTRWLREERERARVLTSTRDRYLREAVSAARQLAASQAAIDGMKLPGDDEAAKILERVAALPGIASIKIQAPNFIFETNSVEITADIGPHAVGNTRTTYDIGRFRVIVDVSSGQIQFHNLTRKGAMNAEHPHIRTPFTACFGDILGSIGELVSDLNLLPELVQTLLRYLRSVNIQDPHGRLICEWPVVRAAPAEPEATGTLPRPVGTRGDVG